MKTIILKTEEAGDKHWAANDARQRSLINKQRWTAQQQMRAERMRMVFETVYTVAKSYIYFGKKQISIKLDHPTVLDAKNLALLEEDYATEGVIKKVSPQGILYCFQ